MLSLQAEKRDTFGKDLQAAREAGKLPIVMYGRKEQSTPLFVDIKIFKKILSEAGESTIVSLATADGDKDVLIYHVDYHPVSGEPIHADLYAVEKGKPVTVNVPFEFIGESPAVKTLGGNLVKVLHELEIEALPKDLPHNVIIDVSSMDALDSQILVGDLKIPAGVTVLTGPEEVVASITSAGEEVVEEAAPVDVSAIELSEERGKKEEETTEAAE